MHDVAVERRQILVALRQRKQVGAHRDQFAGAAGRAVESADQFLAPRLGRKMQVAGIVIARLRAPAFDRLRQFFAVRAEVAGEGREERQPAGGVERVVAVEHVARDRNAGSLATARQQRLAQLQQFGGVLRCAGRAAAPEQGAAALGNRREQVGEKGVGHVVRSNPAVQVTMLHVIWGSADHNQAD